MKRDLRFDVYTLDFSTFTTLNQVATHCFNVYKNVNSPDFLSDYGDYLYELPKDLHTNIFNFKRSGLDCLKVVGCAIDEEKLQKTPEHWDLPKNSYTCYLQFIHFFISACLGYPYSWKTQQNGNVVTDILPLKGFEEIQLGYGSKNSLRFHTEDSFHIARADFLTLMCMRNFSETPTTLFPADLGSLPEKYKDELFKEQFSIIPDDSHTNVSYQSENIDNMLNVSFQQFNRVRHISLLSGIKTNPYLHIDPEIILEDNLSSKAKEAYDYLCNIIEESKYDLVLKSGEIAIINNYALAHGRGAFKANYDGKDRWLERILTLEDIRKTIHCRDNSESHMIVR